MQIEFGGVWVDPYKLAKFVQWHAYNFGLGVQAEYYDLEKSELPKEISTIKQPKGGRARLTALQNVLTSLKCFSSFFDLDRVPKRRFDGIEQPELCKTCKLFDYCTIKNIDFESRFRATDKNERAKKRKQTDKPLPKETVDDQLPAAIATPILEKPEDDQKEVIEIAELESPEDASLDKLVTSYDIYPDKYPDSDWAEAANWPSVELLFMTELPETEFWVADTITRIEAEKIYDYITRFIDPDELTDEGRVKSASMIIEFIDESDLGNAKFKNELTKIINHHLSIARKKIRGEQKVNSPAIDTDALKALKIYVDNIDSEEPNRNMSTYKVLHQFGLQEKTKIRGRITPALTRQIHNLWIMTDLTLEDIGRLFPAVNMDEFTTRYQELDLNPKDKHEIAKATNPSKVDIEEAINIYCSIRREQTDVIDYTKLVREHNLDVIPATLKETLIRFGLVQPESSQRHLVETEEVTILKSGALKIIRNGSSYMIIDLQPQFIRYSRIGKLEYRYLLAVRKLRQRSGGNSITYEQIYNSLVPNYPDNMDPKLKARFCININDEIQQAMQEITTIQLIPQLPREP